MSSQAPTPGFAGLFLSALTAAHSVGDVEPPVLADLITELLERGKGAWPDLPLAPADFVRYLARSLEARETDLVEALRIRHAEDLYLACACTAGIDEARTALARHFRETLEIAIGRIHGSPAFVDEVRQVLYQKLFFEDGQPSGRISGYQGRGPLAGWLAITAQRTALNMLEHEAAQGRAHQRAGAEVLVPELDPELRYLRDRYTVEFERAFVDALDGLSARERTLLGLRIVSSLTLMRIGVMYGVDESTASRWIAAARAHLAELAETILRSRLKVSKTEMESLARLVVSQVDISVARLLAMESPDPSQT